MAGASAAPGCHISSERRRARDPCASGASFARHRRRRQAVLREVTGDYFIGALPVERMAELISPALLEADASLANSALDEYVEWMNGIQYYLTEDVRIAHGHVIYVDSPWALTSVSQPQFWKAFDLAKYGDGTVRGLLSVDISDWDVKGLNGKEAQRLLARRDRARDLGAAQEEPERRAARSCATTSCTPGFSIRTSKIWMRRPTLPRLASTPTRAAAGQLRRHLAAATGSGDPDSELVPGVGLRPHVHRSRDDGGRQRSSAARGQRHHCARPDPDVEPCADLEPARARAVLAACARMTGFATGKGLPWDGTRGSRVDVACARGRSRRTACRARRCCRHRRTGACRSGVSPNPRCRAGDCQQRRRGAPPRVAAEARASSDEGLRRLRISAGLMTVGFPATLESQLSWRLPRRVAPSDCCGDPRPRAQEASL